MSFLSFLLFSCFCSVSVLDFWYPRPFLPVFFVILSFSMMLEEGFFVGFTFYVLVFINIFKVITNCIREKEVFNTCIRRERPTNNLFCLSFYF